MGLHKLTAGDGYTYLTRTVAVHDATDRGHSGLGDYYSEKGESPGRWHGSGLAGVDIDSGDKVTELQMRNLFGQGRHPDADRVESEALNHGADPTEALKLTKLGHAFAVHTGNTTEFVQETARRFIAYNRANEQHWKAPVPAEIRAKIRTEVADEMFSNEHGRPPLDDRERAGFVARETRQATKAVAGYDLTFTPVKSVSTLWALADRDVVNQVEEAHHSAVEASLAWLEKNVLFTRRGRGGIQQVKTRGMIAALFTHRDSRSSDPHLHTHVALSNKVQDPTGRWLAVDGRVLHKANVTLSETYNTLLEAELIARLGVRFEPREASASTGRSKELVREIVGIDQRLAAAWSSRNRHIEARRRELAAAFQDEHGRPPTATEAVGLGQKAWADTRQAKHAPRSEAEQRKTWRKEAIRILGSAHAVDQVARAALGGRTPFQKVTSSWVAETAANVVAKVEAKRATWQIWHLRAEAQRQARTAGVRLSDVESAVDQVVARATEEHSVAFTQQDPLLDPANAQALGVGVPAELTRSPSESVYTIHGSQLFTSKAVLDAEQRILTAAAQTGGRRISDVRVGVAIAETAANGVGLNSAQAAMVRELATSGRRVQLALAPAGTGKTTAMEVLARAWSAAAGTVIGLAPQAVAAQELDAAINPPEHKRVGHSDTLAKLVWHLEHGDDPDWMRAIDAQTLVIIDEAGAASTPDLATAIDHLLARGASVRLIGDDKQLASVAAGGILRDISHEIGAVTLTEVRRFLHADGSLNTAEAAATLAIRDGDPSAIAFYADRGRIHVGDLGTATEQPYAAWNADRSAGRDALLIAPTNELVADLNARARHDRITNLSPAEIGRTVTLADGTRASAGDAIITRDNNRMLAITATDWVKNRDRWTVTRVHDDGSMTVRHDKLRKQIRLPAAYVSVSVQLGYATTVHGAQGATVDTCHLVLTGQEDRNLLYVGLSRGRYVNHLYLATGHAGDQHELIRRDALIPPTALDQLARILERDGSPVSATSGNRALADPRTMLCDAAARYHDAVSTAAESTTDSLVGIENLAEALIEGVTDAPAWPTLRSHLALLALEGHSPSDLLTEAYGVGSLTDTRDPAAVLDARIDRLARQTGTDRPLPWLPALPSMLADDVDWGPYLVARREQVHTAVATVDALARSWTVATAPTWAQPFVDDAGDLRSQLAIWRAALDVPDTNLRPTGPRTIGAPGDHQAELNRAIRAFRPSYPHAQRAWYRSLPESVRRDPWISPLCERLAKLERAGLPVADHLAAALGEDPTGECAERPLPDEHQAAALWWRLVPHLGPAVLEADVHTYDLLTPTWKDTLTDLVGEARADYLHRAPAWPALVAAVDEACAHAGWAPHEILTAAITGLPADGTLSGHEVAEALMLRVATLTDTPLDVIDDDQADRPVDLDEFLASLYRDTVDADLTHQVTDQDYAALQEVADADDAAQAAYEALLHDPYAPNLAPGDQPNDDIEHAFPEPSEISSERILALNEATLAYFSSCCHRSWAPAYLTDRIGTDLVGRPDFGAGYAPPGPHSLLTHLISNGATVDELEQAGLIRTRECRDGTSEWVDVFRDRLILPIRDADGDVIGFIGRRNPRKSDTDYAGPKYLNTRTTAVFTKGEALFGYAENRKRLVAGAIPVIVEGPFDAHAVTLASGGNAVGLAPMGTALTSDQVKLLRRHINLATGRSRVAVAYDNDAAGWRAARTAFWHLTNADLDPAFIGLPDGLDPADLLQTDGGKALAHALRTGRPLGEALVDDLLDQAESGWTDPDVRQKLISQAAHVLTARGPEVWPGEIARLNERLHLSPGVLEHATIDASIERDADRATFARRQIDRVNARSPKLMTSDRTHTSSVAIVATRIGEPGGQTHRAGPHTNQSAHVELPRRFPVEGEPGHGPRR